MTLVGLEARNLIEAVHPIFDPQQDRISSDALAESTELLLPDSVLAESSPVPTLESRRIYGDLSGRVLGGGGYAGPGCTGMLPVRQHERVDTTAFQDAIKRVYARRQTHSIPGRLAPPPRDLAVSYKREAKRVGVNPMLVEAHQIVADWLDPMLDEIQRTRGILRLR